MSSDNKESEQKNYIEAKLIIQEFHDDTNVFVVGTAPFGRVWFDREKVEQQYNVLKESWYEEYGDNETQHSKRPRVISILIDESDPMFNRYRDNIRGTKNEESEKSNTTPSTETQTTDNEKKDNVVVPEKKKSTSGRKKKVNEVVETIQPPVTNETSNNESITKEEKKPPAKPRGRKKKIVDNENQDTK